MSAPTGNFTLIVSNQSFDRPTVDIVVFIDGKLVVSRDFEVEGQHNWIDFTFDLPPGEHELVAGSKRGEADLRTSFPSGERTWTLLQYWDYGEPGDPRFTFDTSDEPFVFG